MEIVGIVLYCQWKTRMSWKLSAQFYIATGKRGCNGNCRHNFILPLENEDNGYCRENLNARETHSRPCLMISWVFDLSTPHLKYINF